MHIKEGYILQEVAGTYLVMPTGSEDGLKRVITLNETGAFMWRLLDQGLTRDEIVAKTEEEYDAPRELIGQDVDRLLAKMRDAGLLVE